MKTQRPFRTFQFGSNSAFSLIEVVFAIAICGFCFAVITAMIPIGLKVNAGGVQQSTAAGLASTVVADLRATPIATGSAVSPLYDIQFPTNQANVTTSFFLKDDGSTSTVPSKFRATVVLTPPTLSRTATMARIWITWTGYADPNLPTLPSKYSGSFETVVGLDRN